MKTIEETLNYILRSITPEDQVANISISSKDENGFMILEITAPTDTIGQIIGKEGRIIKAIRTILGAAYPDIRFNITIKE